MAESFALRRLRWGMSPAEVEIQEGMPLRRIDDEVFACTVELVGAEATLAYTFCANKLRSAVYMFDAPNDIADVGTHERLRNMLTPKYGEPRTNVDRRTNFRREFPATFGELAKAVARGELEIVSAWDTPESRITLSLHEDKDNYNVFVGLLYVDINAEEDEGVFLDDLDLL